MPSPFPGMDPFLEQNPIFQELHTQMLAEAQAQLQRMYDLLRSLDKSRDGRIDPQELADMRRRLGEERVDNIIKELDTDHDGRISPRPCCRES